MEMDLQIHHFVGNRFRAFNLDFKLTISEALNNVAWLQAAHDSTSIALNESQIVVCASSGWSKIGPPTWMQNANSGLSV
jgi:hypothetical protein